jgi:hypothetical protein
MIEISSACVFEEFDFGFKKKKKKLYSTLKIESADFAIHFSYIYVCVCVRNLFSIFSIASFPLILDSN